MADEVIVATADVVLTEGGKVLVRSLKGPRPLVVYLLEETKRVVMALDLEQEGRAAEGLVPIKQGGDVAGTPPLGRTASAQVVVAPGYTTRPEPSNGAQAAHERYKREPAKVAPPVAQRPGWIP